MSVSAQYTRACQDPTTTGNLSLAKQLQCSARFMTGESIRSGGNGARWCQSWAVWAAVFVPACTGADDDIARRLATLPPTPVEHRAGEALYVQHCAGCHGANTGGTDSGPPLAHRVYEPGHHSDEAFHLAVRNGVAAHHWRFGNMPPQPQVTRTNVIDIIGYVRWVQREAGIY